MQQIKIEQNFNSQLARIKQITGKQKQTELAEFFGITQSTVSNACRRGKIPSPWLLFLVRQKRVNPEWVLTGKGPALLVALSERSDNDPLRDFQLRDLVHELLRRVNAAQDKPTST